MAAPRAPWVAVLGALAIAMLAILGPGAGSAHAADTPTCVQPEPRNDDTIHIKGCLTDTRDKPASPVPDVSITVEDSEGNPIGEDTTDETGFFDIALPGTAITNLGQTFVIKIDTDSLPDGSDLRNPDQVELEQRIQLDSDVFVTFPVGDALPGSSGKLTQGLQLAVGGIVFSVLLAMAALGLSMIFGTTGLTNFAHGELITFGALVAYAVDQLPGKIAVFGNDVTVIVAVIAAFLVGGAFGLVNDKALWKPLRMRGTGVIAMMIVSIGLSIFLRNIYQYFAGGQNHNYSQYSAVQPWEIGPVLLTPKDAIVVVVGVAVLIIVSLLLQYTRTGKATRAVADNPALSASSGINVQRVIAVVWTVGAALAALSGALLGLTQGFDYQIGFKILLLVFAATVLGGLGTIWGAMVGAFIIGIFIEVSTLFIPAELKFVGALAVLIIVLMFRPQGLLGRAQRIG
ncbi:branched-chain amino acid ABC transporter permease [Nocardioides pacificus]